MSQSTARLTPAPMMDQPIAATPGDPQGIELGVSEFVKFALEGQVKFARNMTATLRDLIAGIDARISEQLNEIMHHEKFRALEGAWRGVQHLVRTSQGDSLVHVKLLNVTKKALLNDFEAADTYDSSALYKKVFQEGLGQAGAYPFAALVGDFDFSHHPEDVALLRGLSGVAAASFAPFIGGASARMFGFKDYRSLPGPTDLKTIFQQSEYLKWNGFRDTEDSRWVSLAMPRVMARLPYGAETKRVEEFDYEEGPSDVKGRALPLSHEDYCWMNASFHVGANLIRSFLETGLCFGIRGEEGGKLEDLPMHLHVDRNGQMVVKCPAETNIPESREVELSDLGFMPVIYYVNNDFATFWGGQSAQRPKVYPTSAAATENAAISARLPYLMVTSRFTHYITQMARHWYGGTNDMTAVERKLNDWINVYVNQDEGASRYMRITKPLKNAKVQVEPVAGKPGAYNAILYLQPHLLFEQLTADMRLVSEIS